ncbi:hypothetical protein [uncultured Clostridium sp.]|jgi:phage-related protein|uniref:hypothetical protein n=1 Tax=uncultured Clostridium sp. TaxID=59620 RepID=UPI0026022C3B|nr:hypothetical protein [uncultured Clostridium sp.]
MKYLEFNNHLSTDFGLGILSVKLGAPTPNLITEKLPYSNGSFDFSTVVTGGLMTYSDRIITIEFNYLEKNQNKMYEVFSKASSWLLSGAKSTLKFNYIDGFYIGRCTQISNLESFISLGKFTATFTCNPTLTKGVYGDYIWDTFNFIDGITKNNRHIVNTGDVINIQIDGIDIIPSIYLNQNISISLNNKDYNLKIGDNKQFGLIFKNGINKIFIKTANKAIMDINFKEETI